MENTVDDDTVVPESPLSEIEYDTERHWIKNISCEIADECVDIVPDSDDEGMHGTEVVEKNERRGGRCVGKRRYAPVKHSYEGYLRRLMMRGKISEDLGKVASTRDSLGEKIVSSHKRGELNICYIDSQEPGRSSEADALNFVDSYLSNGDPNAFHHVETGVLDGSASSCVLHTNGPQNLARIKNRTSIVKKLEVFDWSENLSDEEEKSFVVNRSELKVECERKLSSNKMESEFQVEDEIDKGACSYEKPMDTNFVNELDKEVIVNSPKKLLEDEQSKMDAVCTYDVGFDTQVAAEAMEALFYGIPLNLDPFCKHQSPQKPLEFSCDPSDSVSVDNCDSEDTGQQLMQSAKKLCGDIPGNFEKPQEYERVLESELLPREISMPFPGKIPRKKRTATRSLRNTIQHKELYHEKNFSRQLDADFNSFKVSNCSLELDNKRSREIRKISSGSRRNRKQSSISSLKRSTDRSFKKSTEVMKFNFPKKRRNKYDVMESGESKKASDSYMNRHRSTGVDEADIAHKLKLEGWNHPRGKRTRTTVSQHSVERNNQYDSCAEDNVIKCPIGNNAMVEIAGPLQSGRKCQYSSKKKHSVNLSMQYSGGPGSLSFSNCKSAITSDKGISSGCDGDNSTEPQPFESDGLVSIVSDVLSTDKTLNVVPRSCIEPSSLKGRKKGRQRGKSRSRPSLTKELSRLGYAEKLPDFMPKGSRRGKGYTNVRVLLSQNLDQNISKQQKKIVARLGFSIASCCSDASHFVADKFLRTKNMLEAIAIGIPVVTHLWLESCGRASCFIDEKMFILRDDKKEKEIGFSMPVSLALSRQCPLLRDHRVYITPNVNPSKDMILSLVNAVQGQVVAETEDITTQEGIIVVSSEEDYTTCAPLLKKGTAVYSSELLLNGIVTQRLEYERHQLFKDFMMKDQPK